MKNSFKMNNVLTISHLQKNYGNISAIKDLSLNLKQGEILSIVGTSGCGKSTLLNILASLEQPTSGTFHYQKENPTIGYMLQEDCLFPWLTIYENACLGIKIQKKQNEETIHQLLESYHLEEFKDKYPHELSGGMKQRVALIRTLAIKPDILLLDEPFSALDYQTKLNMEEDLYKMIKENNIATILVTHDLGEAISLSDRVIILSKRPCTIKKEYEIHLKNKSTPIQNRLDPEFINYHNQIWKDLDTHA